MIIVCLAVIFLANSTLRAPAQAEGPAPHLAGTQSSAPHARQSGRRPEKAESAPSDAQASDSTGKVFLSDLAEFDWKQGALGWKFGKNGQLAWMGKPDASILVNGRAYAKGLSLHPRGNDYTRVRYKLDERYKTLAGSVAICESTPFPAQPGHFLVLGDGKEQWRSKKMTVKGAIEEFSIDVGNVKILELQVHADSIFDVGCDTVWLDPYVISK